MAFSLFPSSFSVRIHTQLSRPTLLPPPLFSPTAIGGESFSYFSVGLRKDFYRSLIDGGTKMRFDGAPALFFRGGLGGAANLKLKIPPLLIDGEDAGWLVHVI